jgi:hypothetical protein
LYKKFHEYFDDLLTNLPVKRKRCQFFHICPCISNIDFSGKFDCAYKKCFVSAFLWQKYFASLRVAQPPVPTQATSPDPNLPDQVQYRREIKK